jgi:hypothetical protein
LLLAVAAIAAIGFAVVPAVGPPQYASGATVRGLSVQGMNPIQRRLLDGFASFEAGIGVPPAGDRAKVRLAPQVPGSALPGILCPGNLGPDVRASQGCLNVSDPGLAGLAQAQNDATIAQNPVNPRQLVAGFQDYQRGDENCGSSFSSDGGKSWTGSTIPAGFTPGADFGNVARQYWQAGGDPAVAWDSRGNAYMACMEIQRRSGTTNNPDASSAIYVFRSTGDGGASWNFPGRPAVETFSTSSSGLPLNNKPFMTVDTSPTSPFRDRIYLTWTLFAADGTSYLYAVHSDDYGQTFSAPVLVSGTSPLCTNPQGAPTPQGTCNENQDSDPFTGPDGTLYVVYNNFNNAVSGGGSRDAASATDNHNQVLLVRSTDGGQTFSAPVKVASYYDLPDCATYQGGQDPGRACVPEKGTAQNSVFRADNYPAGAVNPVDPKQVAITFGSYINKDSNEANGCVPAGISSTTGQPLYTGVKTAGACNNKIVLSVSDDRGATFTGTSTDPRKLPVVNTAPGQARTDQWFQWTSFTPAGTLVSSYYDRQYGSDETTGTMDVSASASRDLARFLASRATSSSMPLPTQFPDTQGNSLFFGDYSGLTAQSGAHPLWMDTRDPDVFLCPGTGAAGAPPALCQATEPNGLLANDENIFTTVLPAP